MTVATEFSPNPTPAMAMGAGTGTPLEASPKTALIPLESPIKRDQTEEREETAQAPEAGPSMLARFADRIPTNGLLLLSALVVWGAVYLSYIR
ncbi:MAG: hypothetical protein AAFR79_01710 [Pseudomonadota bacterium]